MNPLWATAGLMVGTAVLLGYVGSLVLKRSVPNKDALALRSYAVWWFCAGAILAIIGTRTVLYLAGSRDPALFTTLSYILAIPLAVGLAGLLFYLTYIYTGHQKALRPIAVTYLLFFLFVLYYFSVPGERTIEASSWSVQMVGEHGTPVWLDMVFGIAVAGPILVALFAYGSLFFVVDRPEQRFRILMIFTAFFIWFTPLLLGFLVGWNTQPWFPLVYQLPGIPAGLMIILGFRPPGSLQALWTEKPRGRSNRHAATTTHRPSQKATVVY